MLGEAVGFVADILQQAQGVGAAAETEGLVAVHDVDEFLPLGQ